MNASLEYVAPLAPACAIGALSSEGMPIRNVRLPERQEQVAVAYARGMRTSEVAQLLGVTTNTVAVHKRLAMKTIGVRGTAGLVHYCLSRGLLTLGDLYEPEDG